MSQRASVTLEQRDEATRAALKLLLESVLFTKSQHIACYFPQGKEFDCKPFIDAIWQAKKKCYLPVISEVEENYLNFVNYCKNDPLSFNSYNILEPQKNELFPPEKLDLVLLPLVGFDLKGHRLGMGGGYYDRTFSFLSEKKCVPPYLLGLAYAFQQELHLPYDIWDVSLHGVLTEKHLTLF